MMGTEAAAVEILPAVSGHGNAVWIQKFFQQQEGQYGTIEERHKREGAAEG